MKKRKYQQNRIFTLNNPFAPRLCPELAIEIGVNESILLLQYEFWLATEGEELEDGQLWVRKTVQDVRQIFGFWSTGTVVAIHKTLLTNGYLIAGNFDSGKGRSGRWFRFDFEALQKLRSIHVSNVQNLNIESSESDRKRSDSEHSSLLDKDKRINTSRVPQKLPRQPGSDDERNDKATRYKISDLRDASVFGYDVRAVMSQAYPSLPFTGDEDYYLKWYRSRFSTGGITGRDGGKATLEQYVANMENFFQICVENQRTGNGNNHRPPEEYRGPGRDTESPTARSKRENCPDCFGTNNKRVPHPELPGVTVSLICKHENSQG